ncbi:hypothetical protein D3C71_1871940 [compost metagenome]
MWVNHAASSLDLSVDRVSLVLELAFFRRKDAILRSPDRTIPLTEPCFLSIPSIVSLARRAKFFSVNHVHLPLRSNRAETRSELKRLRRRNLSEVMRFSRSFLAISIRSASPTKVPETCETAWSLM